MTNEDFQVLLDEVVEQLCPILDAEDVERPLGAKDAMRGNSAGLTYAEILKRSSAPPPEYLITQLVPGRGLTVIAGEPKSGKSWFALSLGVAVASGKSINEHFVVPDRGLTYYLTDDLEGSVRQRTDAIAAGLGLSLEHDHAWQKNMFFQFGSRPNLQSGIDLCVLVASVRACERDSGTKCKLLVLDQLSALGDETQRAGTRSTLGRLRVLQQALGCAVVMTRQTRKMSSDREGQKMRGSSAIHGAVDCGIYLSKPRSSTDKLTAQVDVESKLSAGASYDLTIKFENEGGFATKAATLLLDDQQSDTRHARALTIVSKLFEQGGPLTYDDLRRKIGGANAILQDAVAIAEESGWIEKHYVGKRHCGFSITEAGREFCAPKPAPKTDDRDDHPIAGFYNFAAGEVE